MGSDRAYRFVIPGWLFVASLGFHYSNLGGNLKFFQSGDYKALLGLIGAFAAGPVLGFAVSTVVVSLLEKCRGEQIHFCLPCGKAELADWLGSLKRHFREDFCDSQLSKKQLGLDKVVLDPIPRADRKRMASQLHRVLNLAIRMDAPKPLIDFAVRRWTVFWSHANSIGAIALGIVFAFALRWYTDWRGFCESSVDLWKFIPEVPILVYVFVAFCHAARARQQAIAIEKDWLLTWRP